EKFACNTTADCDPGRTCDRGYCVVGDGGGSGVDCTTFTSQFFMACSIPQPGSGLDLNLAGTYTYNTDAGTLVDPNNGPIDAPSQSLTSARLISIDHLTIASGTTLRVVGAAPLLVASWSTVMVNGTIDVSSNVTGDGAGANASTCSAHAATPGRDDTGGAGGGGGGGLAG